MRFTTLSLLALVASQASAALHHLFVGTFPGAQSIYTLEFDDEALTLEVVGNATSDSYHLWIALDHSKKNLFATADTSWSSFAITPADNVTLTAPSVSLTSSIPFGGNCTSPRTIFIKPLPVAPYTVYGVPFGSAAGCGNVLSVDPSTGALAQVIQNYTYRSDSGVHGVDFSPDYQYLYSADDSGNSLWTHRIDEETGTLIDLVQDGGAAEGADPRHVVADTRGKYVYVVLEGSNEVGVWEVNENGTGSWANETYPLIPEGYTDSSYWSDEIILSHSLSYLWASSRARTSGGGSSSNATGYISAFALDEATGVIKEQLFLTATETSGGTANAVAPADFSDEWVAMTDSEVGSVVIYRFDAVGKKAEIVAKASINDGGCCANAVWYD